MSKIKTVTLGCRFNFYESEVAKAIVNEISPDQEIVIINTCAVTHEAERQSKQAVRRSIRENPNAKIIVTGCAAKTSNDYFKNLEGVTHIIQNDKKEDIQAYSCLSDTTSVDIANTKIFNILEKNHLFSERSRAFLQIQNGCDNYCSFCIVPFTRGKSKSMPISDIIKRVKYFLKTGFQEIVFSGIDITSYGKDLDDNIELADVLQKVLDNFPELKRIRISSIDPHGITDKLYNLFAYEHRIMPHFHLSIQSGDNSVLKMMRRRHSREEVIEFCNNLRTVRQDIVFGADLIVGFPGETDAMFENTVKLVDEAGLSLLHMFPYSPRQGTLAAGFIQVAESIKSARMKKLQEKAALAKFHTLQKFIGQKVDCLIEKTDNKTSYGKTNHFLPIRISRKYNVGEIVLNQLITSADSEFLISS